MSNFLRNQKLHRWCNG